MKFNPDMKMTSGVVAGALATITVWGVGEVGVVVPPEVGVALAVLFVVVVEAFVPMGKIFGDDDE